MSEETQKQPLNRFCWLGFGQYVTKKCHIGRNPLKGHSHVGVSHQSGNNHLMGVATWYQKVGVAVSLHHGISGRNLVWWWGTTWRTSNYIKWEWLYTSQNRGGGSWSRAKGRWRTSKESKVLKIRIWSYKHHICRNLIRKVSNEALRLRELVVMG